MQLIELLVTREGVQEEKRECECMRLRERDSNRIKRYSERKQTNGLITKIHGEIHKPI